MLFLWKLSRLSVYVDFIAQSNSNARRADPSDQSARASKTDRTGSDNGDYVLLTESARIAASIRSFLPG